MSKDKASSGLEGIERRMIVKAMLGRISSADIDDLRDAQERKGERDG